MKSFALSLAFIMRFKITRKWPITVRTRKASILELFLELLCCNRKMGEDSEPYGCYPFGLLFLLSFLVL